VKYGSIFNSQEEQSIIPQEEKAYGTGCQRAKSQNEIAKRPRKTNSIINNDNKFVTSCHNYDFKSQLPIKTLPDSVYRQLVTSVIGNSNNIDPNRNNL